MTCIKDSNHDVFDFMCVHTREIARDEDKNLITSEETLDLPAEWIVRQFIERRLMKIVTYWC